MLTWIGRNELGGPFEGANATLFLVHLPITVEGVGGMVRNCVGIKAWLVWLDRTTVCASHTTSPIECLLQVIHWCLWIRDTPLLLIWMKKIKNGTLIMTAYEKKYIKQWYNKWVTFDRKGNINRHVGLLPVKLCRKIITFTGYVAWLCLLIH